MGIIPKWMKFASGGGYDSISSAYFARMQTQPSADLKKVIDTYFVKNKKTVYGVEITTKSLLAKMKRCSLGCINDSNDSYINICSNNYHGTKQGSGLLWNPYWGYSNPNGTGWVDTNFNPATDGGSLFTQNNAGFGVYLHNNYTAATTYPKGVRNTNYIAFQANTESFAINQAALLAVANVPFRAGLHGLFRTASNAINAKNQNLLNTTGLNSSTAIPSGNIHLFKCNGVAGGSYTGGLNIDFDGSALTDDEFEAFNLICNEFLKEWLYAGFGADNWGVKMAKSYFDTLHNFEPYEAWEIYEFIKRHQPDYVDSAGTGYLYNTFGPAGQNKTVCDYLMLFKAGGNLAANAWTKTGATLRWNQDGAITSSNTMPAYTRGTNLGIVTVTSTDGWNGLTALSCNQTTNSVNSFYGNFPLLSKIKTGGKHYFSGIQNRFKYISTALDKTILSGIQIYSITSPGYNKHNISDYIGGSYSYFYLNKYLSVKTEIEGNISAFTTEVTGAGFYVRGYDINIRIGLYGTLNNYIAPNGSDVINFDNSNLTGGLGTHNKNIRSLSFGSCKFPTSAVDAQLAVINNYFATVAPIKNVTINLGGATMGIPTGGASNTDLLGIIAKHVAVGFTATITVRS